MIPTNEVWAVVTAGLALIGVSVVLWIHARRELSTAIGHREVKHRAVDPGRKDRLGDLLAGPAGGARHRAD